MTGRLTNDPKTGHICTQQPRSLTNDRSGRMTGYRRGLAPATIKLHQPSSQAKSNSALIVILEYIDRCMVTFHTSLGVTCPSPRPPNQQRHCPSSFPFSVPSSEAPKAHPRSLPNNNGRTPILTQASLVREASSQPWFRRVNKPAIEKMIIAFYNLMYFTSILESSGSDNWTEVLRRGVCPPSGKQ